MPSMHSNAYGFGIDVNPFQPQAMATKALARVAAMVPKTTACLVENPVVAAPVDLLLDETVEEVLLSPTVVMPAGRVVLFAKPAGGQEEDRREGEHMGQFHQYTVMTLYALILVTPAHLRTVDQQLA